MKDGADCKYPTILNCKYCLEVENCTSSARVAWDMPDDKIDILCMPMQKNILQPNPDWKLVECPKCGKGCWESNEHRKLLKENPELKAACTECALRAGLKGKQE